MRWKMVARRNEGRRRRRRNTSEAGTGGQIHEAIIRQKWLIRNSQ